MRNFIGSANLPMPSIAFWSVRYHGFVRGRKQVKVVVAIRSQKLERVFDHSRVPAELAQSPADAGLLF